MSADLIAYPCDCVVPDFTEDDNGTVFCRNCGGLDG